MKTILFDINNYVGHFNITFKLARMLFERGYRIVYLGYPFYKDLIESKGFEFYVFKNTSKDVLRILRTSLRDRLFTNNQEEKIKYKLAQYHKMITAIAPDYVFIDSDQIYRRVFYHNYDVKIISINTKPFTGKIKGTPPFNTQFVPQNGIISTAFTELLWGRLFFQKKINLVLAKIIMKGNDFDTILKKVSSMNTFPFKDLVDYNRVFVSCAFRDLKEVVLIPPEFNFSSSFPSNVYHFFLPENREEEAVTEDLRFNACFNSILKRKKNEKELKVIYVSLGTIQNYDKEKRDEFLIRIKNVSSRFPKFVFILSVGRDFNTTILMPFPKNIFVFPWLPQIKLLPHIDLMINHGGMNSVIECIGHAIPMIAYPLSDLWEQNGNSARITYYGLGVQGNILNDTEDTIFQKINLVFNEYSSYKENIVGFREKVLINNSSQRADLIVDALLDI